MLELQCLTTTSTIRPPSNATQPSWNYADADTATGPSAKRSASAPAASATPCNASPKAAQANPPANDPQIPRSATGLLWGLGYLSAGSGCLLGVAQRARAVSCSHGCDLDWSPF